MENQFTPYRGRTIDYSQPVEIYRNLHKRGVVYSIKQFGRVVAHTKSIVLKKCDFVVSEAGRQRVIKNKTKIVHAFVRGYIGNVDDIQLTFSHILKYNPYEFDKFYIDNYIGLTNSDVVYTQDNQLYTQL